MTEAAFGLFGTGGAARAIMPWAARHCGDSRIMFVDVAASAPLNDYPVIAEEAFLTQIAKRTFTVAVGEPELRQCIAERAEAAGAIARTLLSDDAVILDPSGIGAGAIICPGAITTADVTIGRHVFINIHASVEHDCVVGDFATISPGARLNGAVCIGRGAFIGAGAILREGITVGAGSMIGMGAVVLSDVEAGETVAGNPARTLRRA
ncbi:MAG: NeuD/PglB/VioB family sugar acetyltransferase [Pseudomonadota bacterium]